MELSKNPTQTELRAWSNARQALGPEQHDALAEPTSPLNRIGRVISSTTRGHRNVETRATKLEPSATRRGGSPTRGRKAQPTHNHQYTSGTLDGDGPTDTTTHRSKAKNGTTSELFGLFLSFREPRLLIGSTLVTVLLGLAAFA